MTNFVRLSTRDYVHTEDDDSRQAYRGDLDELQPLTYSRELAFWPWGGARASISSGLILIDNRSGLYDQTVFRDLRDQPISVFIPTSEGPEIACITGIVDEVTAVGDTEVEVTMKDRLALLDVPLQEQSFGDDADPGKRDQVTPITLGIARSVQGVVWQSDPASGGPRVRLHDSAISGLFEVRFNGEISLSTDSPQLWALDNAAGNTGIQRTDDSRNLVTMDVSTSGDAFLATSPADVLGGDGIFGTSFTTAYANPIGDGQDENVPGWVFRGLGFNQRSEANWIGVNTGVQLKGGASPGGYARLIKDDGSGNAVRILEAGKSYRWRFEMTRPVEYATVSGGVINSTGRFVIHAPSSITVANQQPSQGTPIFLRRTFDSDNIEGVYSGTITIPEDSSDRFLEIFTTNGGFAYFKDFEIFEIPPPPPDTLEGISLKDYVLEVVRRVGLPDSDVVTADLDSIDPVGEDIGIHFNSPITALGAVRAPLASFGADIYTDRLGRFRFAQLRDPANDIPELIIDGNNIVRGQAVRVAIDQGKGLTTSMEAARHWYVYRESDFEDGTTVTLEKREQLKQRARFIRKAVLRGAAGSSGSTGSSGPLDAESLPRVYRHAVNADPLLSVFDKADAAAAEIQRIADIYMTVRYFIEVEIFLDPGEFVDINQVVSFKYPRFGFNEGRNMIVVGVADNVQDMGRRRTSSLRLWG